MLKAGVESAVLARFWTYVQKVRQIRAKLGRESQRAIAAQFGVRPEMISKIARRTAWAHVEG